jgi:hypothetical protein
VLRMDRRLSRHNPKELDWELHEATTMLPYVGTEDGPTSRRGRFDARSHKCEATPFRMDAKASRATETAIAGVTNGTSDGMNILVDS